MKNRSRMLAVLVFVVVLTQAHIASAHNRRAQERETTSEKLDSCYRMGVDGTWIEVYGTPKAKIRAYSHDEAGNIDLSCFDGDVNELRPNENQMFALNSDPS